MAERIMDGPYGKASYIPKLRKNGIMVLTDLDGTMTSKGENPSDRELSDRKAVRELLEQKDVVAGAVTARTCGLTLSKKAFHASRELSQVEPPPRWGVDPSTKRHIYVDLAEVAHFSHCLDWDLTAGFGSRIIVKNGCGYRVDREYENLLRYDYSRNGRAETGVEPESWRHAMLLFLATYCSHILSKHLSKLESWENYVTGAANVAPLDFRYQLDFYGPEGLAAMQELQHVIESARTAGNPLALRIAVVDESRIEPAAPESSRYTLYLIPWGARKEKMVHRVFSQSLLAAGLSSQEARLFYAGDTLTDLRTGLYAGGNSPLHFLLPSESRLAPFLIERRDSYGEQDLKFLWANPLKGRNGHRLMPTNQKGIYKFVHKIPGLGSNTLVIADERYSGTTPPGSVAEFLEEFL